MGTWNVRDEIYYDTLKRVEQWSTSTYIVMTTANHGHKIMRFPCPFHSVMIDYFSLMPFISKLNFYDVFVVTSKRNVMTQLPMVMSYQ